MDFFSQVTFLFRSRPKTEPDMQEASGPAVTVVLTYNGRGRGHPCQVAGDSDEVTGNVVTECNKEKTFLAL